ncbi:MULTISPECIES: hypothetical protein [unclassified Nocardioides]|uniref:hypothetical protein n=1 Tax=unclassified Nocardioides TaxID=2615069 RepID=UPI0006FF314D|nr:MULTISPECIES: hypothetical protein [unclassified Nocardioides]KRA38214.1 hypothetical protein ASD81_06075 [Nocardioides sp. Root614]KRA92174.1 hypothetical protein ASD84_06340 [Nocardioides sp. Root682]
MSTTEPGIGWGKVLALLTVLAIANLWFKPFEDKDANPPAATQINSVTEPLVRRTSGWTPFDKATVTPGIQTLTGRAQCTTNFVFTDAAGNVYLGQAAHCASASGDEINGCKARSKPLGTRVTFNLHGTSYDAGKQLAKGRLAYSSWHAMREAGEKDPNTCRFNDFALIRLNPRYHDLVNPSMPHWGGPDGLSEGGLYILDRAYGFGRSSLRRDNSPASRQAAQTMADQPETEGWAHVIIAPSPGIPGDSGSGYVDEHGQALGTLSTLSIGSILYNVLGDLMRELEYAREHSGIRDLRLELGTVAFDRDLAEDAEVLTD